MSQTRCRLLLGLVPADEEAINDALYNTDGVSVVASGADARELLTLAAAEPADIALLSPSLPGLDTTLVAALRAHGLRTAGLARGAHMLARLGAFELDLVVEPPLQPDQLLDLLLGARGGQPVAPAAAATEPRRIPTPREREGSVLAVVGSKGAPGASELAASFSALVARSWRLLLCELDGDGGQLAFRLGVDPREGSLLGLARALRADEPDPGALLSHWLVDPGRGWPTVLLGPPDPPADLVDTNAPGTVERLLAVLAASFPLVVCDVGHRLRRGGEPDPATRLHRDALAAADIVLLVIGSRQEQLRAGLAQLELLLGELGVGPERLRVIVNTQPGSGPPGKGETANAISHELAAFGLTVDAWLPYDEKAHRASTRLGVSLATAKPRGPYARALQGLADGVLLPGAPQPIARKLRLRPAAEPPAAAEEVTLPWRR